MACLASLGRVHEKGVIMDAGCGSGLQSKMMSASMKSDGVLYAFDFSPKMLDWFEVEFKTYDDFNCNINNTFERITLTDQST